MHVVFDLDGVLLDSESDLSWLSRALEATLADFDIEPTDANLAHLYPTNIREFETTAADLGVPVEDLWERRNEHYLQEKLAAIESGEIGPFSDIDVVREIAETHPVSIISNSPVAVVEAFVEACELGDAIEHRIGRGTRLSTVERLKPQPHFFEELHDRAGAEEYVYIGDTQSDQEFAERTGMAYIHLDREVGPIDSLATVKARIESLA